MCVYHHWLAWSNSRLRHKLVEDIDTFRRYAIKREPLKMRHPQIKHESIIYDALAGGRMCISNFSVAGDALTHFHFSWHPTMPLAWTA